MALIVAVEEDLDERAVLDNPVHAGWIEVVVGDAQNELSSQDRGAVGKVL
jgi:hypothetical protein